MSDVRAKNRQQLLALGFRPSEGLPAIRREGPTVLRDREEIAMRFLALALLFVWVAAPEEAFPADVVRGVIDDLDLVSHMTEEEAAIAAQDREEANEEHAGSIGWRLENMWPLAWIIGFDVPPSTGGMVDGELTHGMLALLVDPGTPKEEWLAGLEFRSVAEVDEMEDLFYCAHNAVRSAQLGSDTVPEGFHPIRDGGCIHERRHSLTWALSPGVAWDDTDLST